MYQFLRIARLPVFFLGLIMVWVGDRYLAGESYHAVMRIAGAVIAGTGVIMTLLLSFLASGKGLIGEGKSWRCLAMWQIVLFAGLLGYFFYGVMMGDATAPATLPQKLMLGVWLSLVAFGVFLGAGMEWTMAQAGVGPLAEPERVGRASLSWMTVGMLFISLVCLNYFGAASNVTRDWSYLKTTTPSDATRALLKTTTADIEVALFYPGGNEVLGLLKPYFDSVAQAEPRIKVKVYDKDLHPTQAESYRVPRNGQIVLQMGEKKARIDTGEKLTDARKILRSLDAEFQRRFLEITADKKTAYFTRGHGEFSWVGDNDNPLRSIKGIEGYLRKQNYRLKMLGLAEGSGNSIPDDASVLVIVGPTQPFLDTEAQAIKAYVERGGNLMVYLDIEKGGDTPEGLEATKWPLLDLLQTWGFRYEKVPLGNETNHGVATRSPVDRWFIMTDIFTSHDSVLSLSRHEERVGIAAFQSGYFQVTDEIGVWRNFPTVRAVSNTFADVNKNFKADPEEKKDSYVLGAVGERKPKKTAGGEEPAPSRILLFSDATAISDLLIQNQGNGLYFADGIKWLMGEAELFGDQTSEEDIRISHTSKEDAIWFNATVVLVPLTLLGAGFLATRRRRRRQAGGERNAA